MDKVKVAKKVKDLLDTLKKHDPEKIKEVMDQLSKSHPSDCGCEFCKKPEPTKEKDKRDIIKEELSKEFSPKFQKGCDGHKLPAKVKRCVHDVKEQGSADNPYAVCQASVGKEERDMIKAELKEDFKPKFMKDKK